MIKSSHAGHLSEDLTMLSIADAEGSIFIFETLDIIIMAGVQSLTILARLCVFYRINPALIKSCMLNDPGIICTKIFKNYKSKTGVSDLLPSLIFA